MKKLLLVSCLLWLLVACSNAAQPTPMVSPTLETLPSGTPTDMLHVVPSDTPTLEVATGMRDSGDVLHPHGPPAEEWRGIPIMPDAIAGQEFGSDNAYSFTVNHTTEEVRDFYTQTLTDLGWSQPSDNPFDANGGTMTFRKVGSSLSITVTSSGESVVVLLVMALA